MKFIPVTCAIIEKEGEVLCAQRGVGMKHPYKWEFPGGKKEDYENLETCIKREIKEELGIEIKIISSLPSFKHTYSDDLAIELFPYRCEALKEVFKLTEHRQIKWYGVEELISLDWVEADIEIIKYYMENLKMLDSNLK